jgi:hypothetical protein
LAAAALAVAVAETVEVEVVAVEEVVAALRGTTSPAAAALVRAD